MTDENDIASLMAQRQPVWEALSSLWLDLPIDPPMLDSLARSLAESPFSWEAIEVMYKQEVLPVVHRNLSISGAWIWTGFDPEWLAEQCQRQMSRPTSRLSLNAWWILRKHRRLIGHHWQDLHQRVNQIRNHTASSE